MPFRAMSNPPICLLAPASSAAVVNSGLLALSIPVVLPKSPACPQARSSCPGQYLGAAKVANQSECGKPPRLGFRAPGGAGASYLDQWIIEDAPTPRSPPPPKKSPPPPSPPAPPPPLQQPVRGRKHSLGSAGGSMCSKKWQHAVSHCLVCTPEE